MWVFTRYLSINQLLNDQLGEDLSGMKRVVRKVVVHHTATTPPKNERSVFTILSNIRDYHRKRGWKDIAYHIILTPNGYCYDGRPLNEVGAHCRGHNSDSIGVAMLCDGLYLSTDPPILYNALQSTLKGLCSALGLPREAVFLHRQLNDTECPPLLNEWVEKLRKAGFVSISLEKGV